MNQLKKSKIVTATCAVVAFGLLGASVLTFIGNPVKAATQATESSPNTVSVELDKDVYDGVMGMLHYYSDYDQKKQDVEPEDKFIVEGTQLYVTINGVKRPVIETDQGLYVVISRPGDELIGTLDKNGDKIIDITEDSLPIIGFDENGEPIIGVLPGEEPIEDVIDCENPYILTDEDGNRYYHIVWGDTLCKISSRVHYSVDELAEYNHIRNVHLIYAESDLRIPDWESEEFIEPESESDSETGKDEKTSDSDNASNTDEK